MYESVQGEGGGQSWAPLLESDHRTLARNGSREMHMQSAGIYPNDLDTLKIAFDALCGEFSVLPETSEAQAVASELIRLFQTGMTDNEMLMIAMRARWQNDWKIAG
ncbi:Uncharacterized protein MLTONO_3139 [Mesorhizobium loti]|nr:Uncharacterized protein MLTONO_3139 [Mesorhizobium loti]